MNRWRDLHKYRYLIVASGAIIIATFALVILQYRSAQRTEAQARATMEANLDLHLLELVNEAKRDTLDHANHIMHALRQQRVRDRNVPSIERAFTRALRRYPEVESFYVVFFEPGQEAETWRALRFVPPDPNDPQVQKYDGVPVGKLVEETESTETLRRAWFSIPKHSQTALYSAFDPATAGDIHPRQFFFHTVYELDRLKRKDELERVGLLVLSANAENFPSKGYLNKLVARHEKMDKSVNGLLGKLNYTASLSAGDAKRDLISPEIKAESIRKRGFESSDSLFPNLSFAVWSPDLEAKTFANEYTQSSILLGAGAAMLSLLGLSLTWRATRREMKVAQLKSDFLSSISHELKTPLTAIRAFGDLIHSGRARDEGKIREYGGIIKTESDRLTSLINNILEMSRLERGLRRYRLEEGFLCETVAETVEVFRHTPEAGNCQIKVELPSPPIKTKFDEGAIRQALLNLLSNAVKYSGETSGDRHIEVAVKRNESAAVIEVRDFGIGIPSAEHRHIFTAFHRAPQSEVQSKRGTGLGLAIVREVAQAHGGDVSVESELGAGATFRLHLPLLIDEHEQTLPAAFEENINEKYSGHRRRAERRPGIAR